MIKKQGIERYLQLRKVKDNYNARIPVVKGNQPISAAVTAMAKYKSTSALIQHQKSCEFGIVTERDLLKILANKKIDNSAWNYATKPLVTINEEDSLYQAYLIIKKHNFRHLVVCDSNQSIVGVLSLQHILSDIEIAYVQELKTTLLERDNALKESKKKLIFC